MSAAFDFAYVIAAVIFILGIKRLTKVKTARLGNQLAAVGMLIGVVTTLVRMQVETGQIGWSYIITGVIVGAGIGLYLSRTVEMTAMPELVAVFNGVGGGASVLVALSYLSAKGQLSLETLDLGTVAISIVIGTITFLGSFIAFGKLAGFIKSRPIKFPGNNILNLFLSVSVVGLALLSVFAPNGGWPVMILMIVCAAVLGVLLVTPIGGADMPVVISLLNSYSGLAAAATGFVLKNLLLIVAGALVGASGLILTTIMCKAMNRSLASVLFGGFGQVDAVSGEKEGYTKVKECSPEDVAIILEAASKVIVVPGYGMAVAQAQHAVADLMEALEARGTTVEFAIHPVAGRMPGHMNVLLAEADVPYEKLKELDAINNDFRNADVAIIIGANDVVNPAANTDKTSPIYGMPILNAHEAKTVVVIKRSLSPGFAGIKNGLFEMDNSLMLFADAKEATTQLVSEIKEL
ncbi:MAG: NAD(P)(+) transhydrogenase (Re/Si-specific) subunit beta [archaeon]